MRDKCQGFVLYRQTWQCNENITDCGGKRAVVLPNWMPPQCGAFRRDLQDKSQSPRYSPGVGGGVVTNDYCINTSSLDFMLNSFWLGQSF